MKKTAVIFVALIVTLSVCSIFGPETIQEEARNNRDSEDYVWCE